VKVSYRHHSDRANVRERIEVAIPKALAVSAGRATDVRHEWEGDTLRFSFRALGRSMNGTAKVTDDVVVVEMGLPLMARPFEGKVKSRILEALEDMLGG
jgi:hypothetical protein